MENKKPENPSIQQGITLRDYFAAKALISIGFAQIEKGKSNKADSYDTMAIAAYNIADAMLKQRE